MKIFQPQYQCMRGQPVTLDHPSGWPSDEYPNSDTYGYHDFYELEYFEKGEGTHYINGVPFRVQPGYLYLLIPGDFHCMQLDTQQEYNLWNLKISVDTPDRELIRELEQFPRPLCVCLQEDGAAFFEKELNFLHSCLHDGAWNSRMVKNSADRLLTVLHTALSKKRPAVPIRNDGPLMDLIDTVEKNYPKDISLAQAAAQLGLSENYIGIYFKKHTGLCFTDYLNRTRCFHAAQLLRETNCSVKEISFAVGFHAPEYFSRKFRALFGVSPEKYRKNICSADTGTG